MALAMVAGCTADTVALDGLPCGDEPCVSGWVCHPETKLCVRPVVTGCGQPGAICPTDVDTGDPCPSPGSFIPCVEGPSDCSQGCRTCTANGTWGPCSNGECATCTTYFRDSDGDGVGLTGDSRCLCAPTPPFTALTDGDCDDTPATGAGCSSGCVTFHLDSDGDGYGNGSTGLPACLEPPGYVDNADDCNDANANCTLDCTDGDGDNYCIDLDCHDGNVTCTTDCSTCPPMVLNLTLVNTPPLVTGQTVTLAVDLGAYTRDVAAEITCWSTRQPIFGPVSFDESASTDPGDFGVSANRYTWQTTGTAPFVGGVCADAARYIRLDSHQLASVSLATPVDARDYEQLELSFAAAIEAGYAAGDVLEVQSCCGASCTPAVTATVQPAAMAGDAACAVQAVPLSHDNCQHVRINWPWPGARTGRVGLDDLLLTAQLSVPAVSRDAPSHYTTAFVIRYPGTFDVTCRWQNDQIGPPLTDQLNLTVE